MTLAPQSSSSAGSNGRASGKGSGPGFVGDALDQRIAGLFGIGFAGRAIDDHLAAWLDRGVRAITFFSRNVGSPEQTLALTEQIRARAPAPVLVMVDQEGGRVVRLAEGYSVPPSMRELGRVGDVQRAEALGRVIGRELRATGFDLNFAPVLDLDTNASNPVIGDRSLGADPQRVAALGAALVRGMQQEGVASCAKHFPGHGDTDLDSHYHLPTVLHVVEDLTERELPPFQAAIDAGVAAVMPAHIVFDAIDPNVPGPMSPKVVQGMLREQCGFGGLTISDDLEMGAIADGVGVAKGAVDSLRAGVDLLLISHRDDRLVQAHQAIRQAVESGELPAERVEEAGQRLDRVLEQFDPAGPRPSIKTTLRCPAHLDLLAELGASSDEISDDPTERWRIKPG
ncbi:MAG: beta-N-acetylhexosaminidase [Planctomycetota bacterium]